MKCVFCSGSGLVWFVVDDEGNYDRDVCPLCDGLGGIEDGKPYPYRPNKEIPEGKSK